MGKGNSVDTGFPKIQAVALILALLGVLSLGIWVFESYEKPISYLLGIKGEIVGNFFKWLTALLLTIGVLTMILDLCLEILTPARRNVDK